MDDYQIDNDTRFASTLDIRSLGDALKDPRFDRESTIEAKRIGDESRREASQIIAALDRQASTFPAPGKKS